jgi:hypothetical protein
MGRSFALVAFLTASAAGGVLTDPARAQNASPLAGVWTLNRASSEFPPEIGFKPSWMTTPTTGDGQSTGSTSNGRGRRGSAGSGGSTGAAAPFSARPESYEDARRLQLLVGEVRNPPARLMFVDTPAAVTITNELGQSQTIHPNGQPESIEIEGAAVTTTSRRDGDQLIVVYRVDQAREIRYTYSTTASPARLVVDVQLLEHGTGDKAKRIYESGAATEAITSAAPDSHAASSSPPAPEKFDQRPGAELKGLTSLGVLVEDLSAQAVACGLSQDAIERALSARLTSGGLAVRRNSDDDTYVYVNIMTSSLPTGLCVSRYDAFLYTHATARLSYRDQPVLVQVSLMHRGGIGTSAPPAHGASVLHGLEGYIDLFVTQIHDANK